LEVYPRQDPGFRIFETLGGAITLTYQNPELLELQPGQSAYAYIQIVQLDALDNPMKLISTGRITLVRGKTAKVTTNPVNLLASNDSYAEINIEVKGQQWQSCNSWDRHRHNSRACI